MINAFKIEKPLRHEMVLSVRLDEDTVKWIEDLAGQCHIGKSTLKRMLIIEGLEKIGQVPQSKNFPLAEVSILPYKVFIVNQFYMINNAVIHKNGLHIKQLHSAANV